MIGAGLLLKAALGGLSGVFEICLKHWKPISIALLIAGNVVQWEYYWPNKVAKWEDMYNAEHAALVECEASRTELKHSIDLTNKQVDKWADVAKERQQKVDELALELKEMKTTSKKKIEDILAEKTPETCEAAIEYLRQAIEEDLKWGG